MDKVTMEFTTEQAEVLWAALRGVASDSLMTYANKDRATVDRVRKAVTAKFEYALLAQEAR